MTITRNLINCDDRIEGTEKSKKVITINGTGSGKRIEWEREQNGKGTGTIFGENI